jgi:uncharacterized protein
MVEEKYSENSLTEKQAKLILKKYALDENSYEMVLGHSLRVMKIAVDFALKVPDVNINLVKTGCILHDIGRFKFPPRTENGILHGVVGAKILSGLGLEKHANIALRHIGVGITKEDIKVQGLPLPLQDYRPKTKEEIIICYADNMDHKGLIRDEDYVVERFVKELGEEYRKRVIDFHKKVHSLILKKD